MATNLAASLLPAKLGQNRRSMQQPEDNETRLCAREIESRQYLRNKQSDVKLNGICYFYLGDLRNSAAVGSFTVKSCNYIDNFYTCTYR